MKPITNLSFSEENTIFHVLNSDSSINRMYSLDTPYQVTYEFISGSTDEDYLNAITLSEQGSYFCRENAAMHNDSELQIPPHSHDYYEFVVVLEGSVIQSIEGNTYTYDAGSICFLSRNLSHRERFTGSARVLFLGLSVPYLKDLFQRAKHNSFSEENPFFQTPLARFVRHDMQHSGEKAYLDFMPTMKRKNPYKKLHNLSEQLIDALMQPFFGTSFLVDGLIAALLAYIADPANYHCTSVELETSGDYLLYMRITHLLEEADGLMSRSQLSDALNYSGDYISRIVKKYSGLTLHEYTLKYTLRKAADMLIHSDESVSVVLHDLGFANRTYFYKVFQRQYGMTPREFRLQRNE